MENPRKRVSIELRNFHGVNAWYDLTDVMSVCIATIDTPDGNRQCVQLERANTISVIMVNEKVYAEHEPRARALADIRDAVIEALAYRDHPDHDERCRYFEGSQSESF